MKARARLVWEWIRKMRPARSGFTSAPDFALSRVLGCGGKNALHKVRRNVEFRIAIQQLNEVHLPGVVVHIEHRHADHHRAGDFAKGAIVFSRKCLFIETSYRAR